MRASYCTFQENRYSCKDLDGNFACFKHCIKQIILDLVSLSNSNFASFENTNIPDETLCLIIYILRKQISLVLDRI